MASVPEQDVDSPTKDAADITTYEAPPSDSVEDRKAFFDSFTKKEHKRIMWKVDIRILWLSGLMMVVKNLGSANAANAKVMQSGQPTNIMVQLHMSVYDYNWVSSVFYIALILFEVPSNMMLKYWRPRNWLFRIMFTWGIVVMLHATIKNRHGFYTLRFLLGAMEAGLYPGLFILEGLTTVLFSAVVFFVLPDYPGSPRSRKWLTPREQTYLEMRLMDTAPKEDDPAFSTPEVIDALRDPRVYLFSVAHFCWNFAGYALSWQLPTITTSLGFASLPKNQLLNIPPCVTGILFTIICSLLLRQAYMPRPAYVAIITGVSVVFFGLLSAPLSAGVIYGACIVATGLSAVFTVPFFAWRASSLKGSTGTAFTLAFQLMISQSAGVIAPQLFQSKYASDHYRVPFAICTSFLGLAFILFLWCWWTTRQLESEINRVRRLRIKAERKGQVYSGADADVGRIRTAFGGQLSASTTTAEN